MLSFKLADFFSHHVKVHANKVLFYHLARYTQKHAQTNSLAILILLFAHIIELIKYFIQAIKIMLLILMYFLEKIANYINL